MKKTSLIIIFLASFLFSCKKDEIKIDYDNLLIGVWNYSDFKDDATIFTRSSDFIDNLCYKFNPDGTLIERKNSGFCGTPPVSYSDYPGSWKAINDTVIEINGIYWGGTTTYQLEIESLNTDTLKVVTLSVNRQ
jgi:hypothetical protein